MPIFFASIAGPLAYFVEGIILGSTIYTALRDPKIPLDK